MANRRASRYHLVARLLDRSFPSKSQACTGSSNVLVNNRPVLRVGDRGTNGWIAIEGAPRILVNNRLIHRLHDAHSASEAGSAGKHTAGGNHTENSTITTTAEWPDGDLLLRCEHKIGEHIRTPKCNQGRFDVVGTLPSSQPIEQQTSTPTGSPDSKSKERPEQKIIDKITIVCRNHTAKPPEEIMVIEENCDISSGVLVKANNQEKGYTLYTFDCEYKEASVLDIFNPSFWTSHTKYRVEGLMAPVQIRHYSPHQWEFRFGFPPMNGIKMGSKVSQKITDLGKPPEMKEDLRVRDSLTVTNWHPIKAIEETDTTVRNEKNQIISSKAGSQKQRIAEISLMRDGVTVTTKNIKKLLSIIQVVRKIFGIIRSIQDHAPRIGWYFEANVQLMTGTFALQWGWKEFKDHRAYMSVITNARMDLLTASIELGFGLQWMAFKTQVFANLSGKVTVDACYERSSPDDDVKIAVGFNGSITGTVGIRCDVGNWAHFQVAIETGIIISGAFVFDTVGNGFHIEGTMKWTGITVKANAAVKQGEHGTDNGIISTPPSDLGAFKWPGDEYKAEWISKSEIQKIIIDKLTVGLNLEVYVPIDWDFDEYIPVEDVAMKIAEVITSRSDIFRDSKSVEAMAHDIRQRLNDIGTKSFIRLGREQVSESEFREFLTNDLNKMLDNYIDPTLEAVQQLQQCERAEAISNTA